MRRRSVHALFGVAVAGLVGLIALDGLRLQHARHINSSIAHAGVLAMHERTPEAEFARALALGRAGDYEGALQVYKDLAQSPRTDLRQAALYNLGNLHLRAALAANQVVEEQALPLVELAKQSYRNLLRENPTDWDARYNLERALYRAPEGEDQVAEDEPPPPPERSVATLRAQLDLP